MTRPTTPITTMMKYIQNGILSLFVHLEAEQLPHEIYTEWNFEKQKHTQSAFRSDEIYTEWNFETKWQPKRLLLINEIYTEWNFEISSPIT